VPGLSKWLELRFDIQPAIFTARRLLEFVSSIPVGCDSKYWKAKQSEVAICTEIIQTRNSKDFLEAGKRD